MPRVCSNLKCGCMHCSSLVSVHAAPLSYHHVMMKFPHYFFRMECHPLRCLVVPIVCGGMVLCQIVKNIVVCYNDNIVGCVHDLTCKNTHAVRLDRKQLSSS